MLLWGGALKSEFRGKTWDRVGSLIDLLSTLLKQLSLKVEAYTWGNDLFDANAASFANYEIGKRGRVGERAR